MSQDMGKCKTSTQPRRSCPSSSNFATSFPAMPTPSWFGSTTRRSMHSPSPTGAMSSPSSPSRGRQSGQPSTLYARPVRANRFSLRRSSSRRRNVSMPAARRMTRQLPSLREFMPSNETRMDVGKHSWVRRLRHPGPKTWPSHLPRPNPNSECMHVTSLSLFPPQDPKSNCHMSGCDSIAFLWDATDLQTSKGDPPP